MLDRRHVLVAGASGLAAVTLGGVAGKRHDSVAQVGLPAGYHMPLESEPHERTFMQWPVATGIYGRRNLEAVQRSIAAIANVISQFEPVVMLGSGRRSDPELRRLSSSVERWDIPTDDLWCRDSGPTFVIGPDGNPAVAHIRFNGWGNKQRHSNDGKVAARVAQRLGLPLLETGLVGEQGGIEHDGAGTLLAHASCWDNPNRNRLSRPELTRRLLAALGGQKMIWAPGVIGQDITDYHIDALARFVGPGHVLIQIDDQIDPDDPWSVAAHETLAVLKRSRDAQGRPLRISMLPEPQSIRSPDPQFVSSYINYYVCNGGVIAAQFGDARTDEMVRDALERLYPGRNVVLLNVDPVGESGGGIHCATQQQPKV